MKAAINSSKHHLMPWLIWFVAALFYLYEYFLQVSPNAMSHELMNAFKIDGTHLGILGGVYFITYAAMQIPVGLFLDRLGPRKSLILATSVCAFGCFLFGLTHSFTHAILARLFLGFGSAFAAVACLKIVASWFPMKRFAVLTGLTVTMGTLGGVIGQAPLALLVAKINWRPTMFFLALLSSILLALVLIVIKDKPIDSKEPRPDDLQHHKKIELFHGLSSIIKSRQCWLVAIYGGLVYMPSTILGTLWGTSFVSAAYTIPWPTAAGYISMIFVGWLVGSPLFGHLSDRTGLRKAPMYLGSIGAFVCLTSFIYLHPPLFMLSSILFAFGFLSSGFLTSFSIILEINHPKEQATALGFMNTLNMLGPVLLQPLIGYILDTYWHGQLLHGVPIYSVVNYQTAFIFLPLSIFASIIVLPFIHETYCRRVHAD